MTNSILVSQRQCHFCGSVFNPIDLKRPIGEQHYGCNAKICYNHEGVIVRHYWSGGLDKISKFPNNDNLKLESISFQIGELKNSCFGKYEMMLLYQSKPTSIIMEARPRSKNSKYVDYEVIFHSEGIMNWTPDNAEEKLKTILTFM